MTADCQSSSLSTAVKVQRSIKLVCTGIFTTLYKQLKDYFIFRNLFFAAVPPRL